GWGQDIQWTTLDNAYDKAKELKKPILLIIHKSWCSACKALKKKFVNCQKVADLSNNFVMVNIEDDDNKTDKKFNVDGAYAPRIYFIDPFTKE
ncbi:thioredoxin family protein, partial [Salmonella sp. s51090]|uniref:thioredoxin family protein n=1 Tax=Salmonella sp. s51090 TaxID=3159651 RepID=UPI00397F0679